MPQARIALAATLCGLLVAGTNACDATREQTPPSAPSDPAGPSVPSSDQSHSKAAQPEVAR